MTGQERVMDEREARLRDRARQQYHDPGVVEVDADAPVSASDDGGYVQAWVWVDDAEG